MKGDSEVAALVAAVDGDAEFEVAIGEALGRFRRRRDAAIRDKEAADLLHLGWRVIAEKQGGCRATAYNRASRGRESKREQHG